jgi:hypothetical protein
LLVSSKIGATLGRPANHPRENERDEKKKANSAKLAIRHSAPSGPQSAHWPTETFATISTMLFDCRTVVQQERGNSFCDIAKKEPLDLPLDRCPCHCGGVFGAIMHKGN